MREGYIFHIKTMTKSVLTNLINKGCECTLGIKYQLFWAPICHLKSGYVRE